MPATRCVPTNEFSVSEIAPLKNMARITDVINAHSVLHVFVVGKITSTASYVIHIGGYSSIGRRQDEVMMGKGC